MVKFLFLVLFAIQPNPQVGNYVKESPSKVYVCNSSTSKKYHYSKSCRGLNACSHQIVVMSVSDARNKKLTLCGWED